MPFRAWEVSTPRNSSATRCNLVSGSKRPKSLISSPGELSEASELRDEPLLLPPWAFLATLLARRMARLRMRSLESNPVRFDCRTTGMASIQFDRS